MFATLNDRLTQAAERVARREKLSRRVADLEAEHREAAETAERLKEKLHQERLDVEQLEGISLTALLATILGSKEQQLEKERQDALAAELKYPEARTRLKALEADLDRARCQLRELDGAEAAYQELLREKEELISRSGRPGAEEIFRLTEREQELDWHVQQLSEEAHRAGVHADGSLARVVELLKSARNWGTWDILGGGLIATHVKHSRMDAAQAAAHAAQRDLAIFRRELKDVSADVEVGQANIEGFARFADHFFDGLIADWVVQSRINQSLQSAQQARHTVRSLLTTLESRLPQARRDLEQVREGRMAFIQQFGA